MHRASARYAVVLTAGAEQDLESLHDYIAGADGVASADRLLDKLMSVVERLSRFPERGDYPRELIALGMREFRQTSFKPYRMIYRVLGREVVVFVIADGRRDMQSLLARRLLGG